MDARSLRSEITLAEKQTLADFLKADFKSAQVREKSKKRATCSDHAEGDPSLFHLCLKETVEQKTSRKNDISQDMKTSGENLAEEVKTEYSLKSSNDKIFSAGEYREAGLLLNENNGNPDSAESEATNERCGIKGVLQKEALPVRTSENGDAISGNQNRTGVYPAQEAESDMSHIWNAFNSEEMNILPDPVSAEMENPEKAKPEIAGGLAERGGRNNDSGISISSPSSEVKGIQSQTQAEEQVSAFSESFQGKKKDTTSASRAHQPHEDSGQVSKKEELAVPRPPGKDLNNTLLDSNSDSSEINREILLSRLSVPKENLKEGQEIRFNKDLIFLTGNSSPQQIETDQFFSVDNRTFNGKSGEFKINDPQVLINQIGEEGKQAAARGGGRIKITLHPPNLGSLDMDIRVRNNQVEVVIIADTPEIQQSLQANVDLLKTALNQQGLKVDGYNVLLQGSMDSNSGYFSGEGALWRNARKDSDQEETGKKHQKKPDLVASLNPQKWPDPIDSYKISLFI